MMRSALVGIFLLLLASPSTANAKCGMVYANVFGKVVDYSKNKPIKGATIYVFVNGGGLFGERENSILNGSFSSLAMIFHREERHCILEPVEDVSVIVQKEGYYSNS